MQARRGCSQRVRGAHVCGGCSAPPAAVGSALQSLGRSAPHPANESGSPPGRCGAAGPSGPWGRATGAADHPARGPTEPGRRAPTGSEARSRDATGQRGSRSHAGAAVHRGRGYTRGGAGGPRPLSRDSETHARAVSALIGCRRRGGRRGRRSPAPRRRPGSSSRPTARRRGVLGSPRASEAAAARGPGEGAPHRRSCDAAPRLRPAGGAFSAASPGTAARTVRVARVAGAAGGGAGDRRAGARGRAAAGPEDAGARGRAPVVLSVAARGEAAVEMDREAATGAQQQDAETTSDFPAQFNQLELLETHGHLIPTGSQSLWAGDSDDEEEQEEKTEEWYQLQERKMEKDPSKLLLWAAEKNRVKKFL
ncbi:Ankyrin repeat domain-containing protein 49 [Galemys pyrenaicus]|uniref:Ankyrin repeat domain-containing protein 49 n=1 Tax=Galemys pyrenaicus TaxID=202257 RepID=A0A8J6AU18_GALPY|nr:Ankyrin repeat domain-containing protein 49 [Galemys pyrenaicus]